MAGGLNKAMLIGYLGADPEMRSTNSGSLVTNFRMATTESWKDKEGAKQERAEWHRITVWGKLAEICDQYLHKGSQAYVEGRLQTREWEDRDGNKRFTTEVVAREVVFLGGKREQGDGAGGNQRLYPDAQPGAGNGQTGGGGAAMEDDYPF